MDSINVLSFFDSGNNLIGTVTGNDVPGTVNQGTGPNDTRYVNITSTTPFASVIVTSPGNSFEIDDVAYAQTVPEPTSGLLLSTGIIGLAFKLRRKFSC